MKRLFIVLIILFILMGFFSMDILGRSIVDIQRRMVGQTDYRINVVKGVVATVNINRTFGCYIAGETVIYPNIPTFSRDPKLEIGDQVTIEFINGCRETPVILAPEDIRERPDTTEPIVELTLFESQIVNDNNWMNAYGTRWIAYFFQAESNHTIEKIQLYMTRTGFPSIVTVSIFPNEGSGNFKPVIGGGALTSGTTDGDTLVTTVGEWREIEVASYALTSGTWYSIVIKATSGNATNYASWWGTNDNVLPDQWRHSSDNSGVTWYSGQFDLTYKIYGY